MLKSFEISNLISYKNKTKVDLECTNYQTLASTSINGNVLKGAMFVGANASGKSNTIISKRVIICIRRNWRGLFEFRLIGK